MGVTSWGQCQDASGVGKRYRTYHCHAMDGSNSINQDCLDFFGWTPATEQDCDLADVFACPAVEDDWALGSTTTPEPDSTTSSSLDSTTSAPEMDGTNTTTAAALTASGAPAPFQ